MKTFVCKKCLKYGGKQPCILMTEEEKCPDFCPFDDGKNPSSEWKCLTDKDFNREKKIINAEGNDIGADCGPSAAPPGGGAMEGKGVKCRGK